MATKPDVAWIGVHDLERLEGSIPASPCEQQKTGWAALVVERRWRELAEAVARDWPDHPDPLDDSAVLRRLEALAASVAGRSPSIRQQVIEDAPGLILLAFARVQRSRPFNPWARRVLRNHAVSLYRRQRRTRSDFVYLDTAAAPLPSLAEDDLAEVLLDFRRLCDQARFPLRTADGPELAAVFALEVRLRLLPDLVFCSPGFLDSHLPLRGWERALRVQRDWPTLGELWDWLAESAEPGLRHSDAVRCACRQLAPDLALEGPGKVWNTWVNRAKIAVEPHLESHGQARLFFYLFPRHRRSKARSAPDEPEGSRQAS